MRVTVTSVPVNDQERARDFYTEKLGFEIKNDVPVGESGDRWLTVVSPEDPDGTEVLLEPLRHPAAEPYQSALRGDGIPWTQFGVEDVEAETARLKELGVEFTMDPVKGEGFTVAVFDDTCGNLIQIIQTS
ncbi:VOC family protein [Dietzia sp.]|uniref:VOC family protein n=1 Tax=Dietzia sp. TaxID=1871616 RepID=UPI002FDA9C6F